MREILQGTDDALTKSGQKSIDPSLRLPLADLIADYTPDTYEIFKLLLTPAMSSMLWTRPPGAMLPACTWRSGTTLSSESPGRLRTVRTRTHASAMLRLASPLAF